MLLTRRVLELVESKEWVKSILVPIIVLIPPSIIGGASFIPSLQKWLEAHLYSVCILIGWPVLTVCCSVWYQKNKPKKDLTTTELHSLLRTLAQVVGKKTHRFAAMAKDHGNKRARDVFNAITRPDIQIEEIVAGIYKFFEATRPSSIPEHELKIRVLLGRMGPQHIKKFEVFYPPNDHPRSKIDQMQDPRCGFSRALQTKEIVVIPDKLAESNSGPDCCFLVTDKSRQLEEGSMICYPVIVEETGEIPYVISISTAQKSYFQKEHDKIYKSILSHFAQRITLEFHLQTIKTNVL